ncbi:hypothetical protein H4R18_005830 [Coemansia javaensis]|uniref:Uncharacterized protein n=1 Tax=Coemansia javaensis TaxID=2761396 RepID=A0A9W8LER3_9FUNG|nr:hypothetical protein H4R18_005830 [Coemansia javaensis]
MLMSVDARDPVDQGDRVLDCLELDPYAPEEYFDGAVGRLISSLEPGAQARALRLVVDRVERGDPQETGKWRQLARLLSLLRQSGGEAAVEAAMGERRRWWGEAYFGWHAFGGTRPPPAPPTEQAVYMAVCAQQLLDLEQGHPVYGILSGELDDALADFVDEHMRVL